MAWANKTLKAENIKYIIAHCSAGPIGQKAEDIVAYHKKRWPNQEGMSYAYFIEEDGAVRNGRPELSLGFHAGNLNDCSIGFCAAGGVDTKKLKNGMPTVLDNFTDAQRESIAKVALVLLARYPNAKIIGHNEVCTKACPVYDIHAILRDVRIRPGGKATPEETHEQGNVAEWKQIKYFNSSEFEFGMNMHFVKKLDAARAVAGVPFVIIEATSSESCIVRAKNAEKKIASACEGAGLTVVVASGEVFVANKS